MGIKIWPSTKDVPSGMGIKIISDLVLKEICGICETKNATKEQLKEYIMAEWRIFEKFDNLSKDELNAKSNKNIYMRNNVMSTIIKCYSDEKKRDIRAIDGFRKKLMIPDSKFEVCRIWSQIKIGKLFMYEKILEEYSVKIYEIDPYFLWASEKK